MRRSTLNAESSSSLCKSIRSYGLSFQELRFHFLNSLHHSSSVLFLLCPFLLFFFLLNLRLSAIHCCIFLSFLNFAFVPYYFLICCFIQTNCFVSDISIVTFTNLLKVVSHLKPSFRDIISLQRRDKICLVYNCSSFSFFNCLSFSFSPVRNLVVYIFVENIFRLEICCFMVRWRKSTSKFLF